MATLEGLRSFKKPQKEKKFEIVASLRSSIWNTRFSHICVITSSYRKKDKHGLVYGLLYYSKCICLVKWQLFVIIDAFIVVMDIMDAQWRHSVKQDNGNSYLINVCK